VQWAGAALFTVVDGKIQDVWVLGDVQGLAAQLKGAF
jgi:predicted ester cyclase